LARPNLFKGVVISVEQWEIISKGELKKKLLSATLSSCNPPGCPLGENQMLHWEVDV
jgi:hypothetical protein